MLDAEAAKHLSEGLKENKSLTALKYAAASPPPYCQDPLTSPVGSCLQVEGQ